MGQVPELHLERRYLREHCVGRPTVPTRIACPDVHRRFGYPAWRVEGRHQVIGKASSSFEIDALAAQRVGAEQASQSPDGDLEEAVLPMLASCRQLVVLQPRSGFVELRLEAHDPDRRKTVQHRHRHPAPVRTSATDRFDVVAAPSPLPVARPGVAHCLADLIRPRVGFVLGRQELSLGPTRGPKMRPSLLELGRIQGRAHLHSDVHWGVSEERMLRVLRPWHHCHCALIGTSRPLGDERRAVNDVLQDSTWPRKELNLKHDGRGSHQAGSQELLLAAVQDAQC
mmetsp:Transcript_38909/g.82855  ORF Transcript_38909/g.82855 Transcript_38909/m.82855 type:complete len:284 (-) Transcript_38909:1283-2134(-)